MRVASRILRPKLRPPRMLPNRLERQRLFAQLDHGLSGQFTLVAAPAGYGKTTLLSQWIKRQDLPTAWLTVDEQDNEPTLFLETLVAAVTTVLPESCRGLRSLLGKTGSIALELLTRELVSDLDDLEEFILVLDDSHNLRDPSILQIIRRLISQPPCSLHLVLSCRADPMLPLGALRGRGLLNEIRAADLRFTEEETRDYLQSVLGRALTNEQTAFLLERTEGWVTGLHLVALSLLSREDVDKGIRELAGSDRYIAAYLMEELLTRLDPAVQEYLTLTSVLDRLCGPLCRAVTGESTVDTVDGQPILEWLVEANLFAVSLDERREWFRYHHLLRDVLRHSLYAARSKEDVAALHVRAGMWLGANGFIEDALAHFASAGRSDLARDVVEAHRLDAMDREQWRALERWASKLGSDIIETRPGLVLVFAWIAHERQDWADLCRHCDHAEQLLDLHAQLLGDDEALFRGEIAALRAEVSFWRGEGDDTLSYARQALTGLPLDSRLSRATAILFEGAGLHLLGKNEEAFQVLARGSFGEYGKGVHPRVMVGLALLAFMNGKVNYAQHVARLILAQTTDSELGESTAWAHFFLGLAAYLRNDLPTAEEHYRAIEPYASHIVPTKQSAYGMAWIRQACGAPDEALEIMDGFMSSVSDLNLPIGQEVQLLRARLAALSGWPMNEVTLARSLLPAAGDEPLSLQICFETSAITAIAVLLLEGGEDDLPACEAGLQRLLATAETNGNVFRSVQCHILRALILDRQGRDPEALASLAQALVLAKPGRLIRLFPEMGDRVYPLLQALRVRGRRDAFIDEVMASFDASGSASSGALPLLPSATGRAHLGNAHLGDTHLAYTLMTRRELEVLELLERRLSNKEIARQLVISPATVKRHTLSIYSKLGVGGRRDAVLVAQRLGLVPVPR